MMEQPLCDPGVGGGTGSVLLAPLSQQLESCSRQSDWFRAHHLPHQLSVAAPSSTSRSCGLDSQNDSAAPEQFRSLGQARNAWPGVLVFNDSGLTEVFRSQLVCLLLRPVCAFCRSLFRIFFCRHGRTITRVTDPVYGVCVCSRSWFGFCFIFPFGASREHKPTIQVVLLVWFTCLHVLCPLACLFYFSVSLASR